MHRAHRTIAAAVTLLFLAGVLEAHVHRALARHGFCTEHGEPIHLEEAPRATPVAGHHAVGEAPAPAHGEHGCAALSFLTAGAEAPTTAPIGTALLGDGASPALARASHPSLPPIALAPKGSPPL